MKTFNWNRHVAWNSLMSGCFAVAALSGCASRDIERQVTPAPLGTTLAAAAGGRVMGGQQPVSNASLQLYAVNLTIAKGASSPVFAAPILSNRNGEFTFPTFSCQAGSLVYLMATGGDAGAGTNPAISVMAALGLCSGLSASTFVNINEVTTVASVYALAPFMADYTHIGASASNLSGITNAFANVNSLVNIATGATPGASAPANATIPSAEIYTLANIIAMCVNSNGGGTCTSLFALAPPLTGSVAPAETTGAMLNIARNPGNNVPALFYFPLPTSPFGSGLQNRPGDWTMAIHITGSGLSSPYGVAIDAMGDAWVTNESGDSITELSPQGAALSGASGYGSPYIVGAQGLTIDSAGRVWIANTGGNSIVALNAAGGFVSSSGGYKTASISGPIDIAADARGNIWVANFDGNSVTELNSSGILVGAGGLTAGGSLLRPDAIAIDPSGGVWIGNSGAGTLTRYDKNANLISAGYTDNALQGPTGLALDAYTNAWVAGAGGSELTGIASAGAAVAASPILSSLAQPTGVAIDGSGAIWVANSTATGFLSEFAAGTGIPIAASQALGSLSSPVQIAIDASGNLWSANSGDNSVTLFIGAAAPVQTPLVSHTN